MKKFQLLTVALVMAAFFVVACDDNKKEDIDDVVTDTDEASDDLIDDAVVTDTTTDTVTDTTDTAVADEDLLAADDDVVACPVTATVEHDGEELTAAAAWTGSHLIKGTLYVKAALTLDECTKVIMEENAKIVIQDGGSMVVSGTADHIVTFASAKAAPAAGDWAGIEIYETASSGNSFQYTAFSHGGGDDYGVIWVAGEASVAIDNCLFTDIQKYGIMFENGAEIESFTGNQFAGVDAYPIWVGANAVAKLSPIVTNDVTDRVLIRAEDVVDAGTWKNLSIGYEVDYLYINQPITLEAGTAFYLNQNSHFTLRDGGSLIAVGTELAPIVFTSAKAAPGAGDWKGILIYETASNDSAFENVMFQYGGGDDYGVIWVDGGASVSIDNCKFHEIQSYGITFENGAEIGSFTGNEFTVVDTYPVWIGANSVPALDPIVTDGLSDALVKVRAEDIDDTGTWQNLSIGYDIDYLYVHKPITIAAGTTLYLHDNSHITIRDGGALALAGTETDHVTITSYKDVPSAGDWKTILLYSTGSNAANIFTYADIKYGGGDDYGQLWVEDGASVVLDHVVFSNGQTCDVTNDNGGATITETASTLTDCVI
ncbi:MAG TPA: hypothetical protein PLV42_00420 [bacterium]|nr:hypothetical protein [bacterium]